MPGSSEKDNNVSPLNVPFLKLGSFSSSETKIPSPNLLQSHDTRGPNDDDGDNDDAGIIELFVTCASDRG
jgi:hypothetical protein